MTETIETKINQITDATTEIALATLKTELSIACLDPVRLTRLKALVKEKNNINRETREKLDTLLKDCSVSSVAEKAPESKTSFEQVFAGTKSKMFSLEKIKAFELSIDGCFEQSIYSKLSPEQKTNIRLAMMDKFLKDPEIQKLFDMKIGVVDILSGMMKGEGPKIKEEAEGVKKSTSVVDSISQAEKIFQTIKSHLLIATKPLEKLLKTDHNPSVLLSNPKAIAEYNGGDVASDIQEMNKSDLDQYIKGLNGNIRNIDAKIFPMEEIKEKGMNFLAEAPSFLMEFFKWLLSFDFIAKLLGYKDGKDALGLIDDELKQRKSLNILREFGKVNPLQGGQAKDGEYSGKIDILKGHDLSKIDRKKLAPFFQFTREDAIETGTPEFWIGVFNRGEIVKKDEKGVEIKYSLVKPLDSKDLEKDFEGLYGKLNDFLDQKKKRDYTEGLKKQTETPVPKSTVPSESTTPTPPAVLTDTRRLFALTDIGMLTTLGTLSSEERKQIVIGSLRDWGVIFPKTGVSDISKISKETMMIDQFCKNNPVFLRALRKESGNPIVTLEDFWKHKDSAILAANKLPPTPTISLSTGVTAGVKPAEVLRDETTLLVEAFTDEQDLPFEFGADKKQVKFENGRLMIGTREFVLKLSNGGPITPEVGNITLIGADVKLGYKVAMFDRQFEIKRSQIINGIPGLLAMKNNAENTIEGEDKKGKLIITRVV